MYSALMNAVKERNDKEGKKKKRGKRRENFQLPRISARTSHVKWTRGKTESALVPLMLLLMSH